MSWLFSPYRRHLDGRTEARTAGPAFDANGLIKSMKEDREIAEAIVARLTGQISDRLERPPATDRAFQQGAERNTAVME